MTTGEALVGRFYHELWNQWRLDLAEEILAENFQFRGSLGSVASGRSAFKRYVERVRGAFPDWHNQVDELFSAGNRVVARLTWTGTHRGPFAGIPATGNRVQYVGAGLFTVSETVIETAWIVGDTQALWHALGRLGPYADAGPFEPPATEGPS